MIKPIVDIAILKTGEPYPERIGVAMKDGKKAVYVLEVKQPNPIVVEMNTLMRETKIRIESFGGYKYKEKGGRRRCQKK